ncbi:MAG: hypothetical protein WC858_04485 [Parcubacteria group bacterium]|jgi:hypothetical protein
MEKVSAKSGSAAGGKNKIFAFVVLGLNVIAAWVSWWVLGMSVYGKTTHYWLFPVLAFSFWAIAFVLSCIFLENRRYVYASYIAGALGYPISMGFNWSDATAALVVLTFVLIEIQTKKESKRGVKIDFRHLVSHALKYFVTIVCVVIGIAYYFSITNKPAPTASAIEAKSLETEIDWGLKAASFVLQDDKKALIADISSGMTVDEYFKKTMGEQDFSQYAAKEDGSAAGDSNATAKLIGDATALKIQEQMLEKSKKNLSKQLGVTVYGEQRVKDVLIAYIDKSERSFFEYSNTDKFYIPIILAFGIFLTARILATAVDIFLGLSILLLIKLLRRFNVIEIKQEQREVSFIEYSI